MVNVDELRAVLNDANKIPNISVTPIAIAVKEPPTEYVVRDKETSVFKIIESTSAKTLFILGVISVVPILQFIIEWRHVDDCPINWYIRNCMIVVGIIWFTHIVLAIVRSIVNLKLKTKQSESNSINFPIILLWIITSILWVLLFLTIFQFGWFIGGCIRVFRVWDQVQYIQPKRSDYCHTTLYRFGFCLLNIGTVLQLLSCSYLCVKTTRQLNRRTKSPISMAIAEL